jgi:hypothetical protein
MNRVRGIGGLAINLVTIAIINEAARVEALANKNIPFHDPRITLNHLNFDSALYSELNQERIRLITQWMKDEPNFHLRMIDLGLKGINEIIELNKPESRDAVQATMAAMLIGLWTAFESLAQDTWITAVNARPNPLATRVLKRNADLGTGTQPKSIPPEQIIGHSFDLRNSMGTILFRQRAVDFQQLKTIRVAYKVAFAEALETIFENYHQELFWLETERNLFVHKGGLVDRKFIERMGDEPDMTKTMGASLVVNGQQVAHKANVVSRCATELIQAVDKWLDENPETTPSEA